MPLLTLPAVVAVICTVPVPAGETAVIWVEESTVNDAAGVPPKLTPVVPVRLVPVRTTAVPPASGPELGETVVRVGTAAYV